MSKYVVLIGLDNDTMTCEAMCKSVKKAYGYAYAALADKLPPKTHYITIARRGNENLDAPLFIEAREKATDKIIQRATIWSCNNNNADYRSLADEIPFL